MQALDAGRPVNASYPYLCPTDKNYREGSAFQGWPAGWEHTLPQSTTTQSPAGSTSGETKRWGLVVTKYDPTLGTSTDWKYAPELAPYRTQFSVAGLSGRLYVVGGMEPTIVGQRVMDCRPTTRVLSIDPATGSYIVAAPLKFAHPAHLSIPLGFSLVAVEQTPQRDRGSVMYAGSLVY